YFGVFGVFGVIGVPIMEHCMDFFFETKNEWVFIFFWCTLRNNSWDFWGTLRKIESVFVFFIFFCLGFLEYLMKIFFFFLVFCVYIFYHCIFFFFYIKNLCVFFFFLCTLINNFCDFFGIL